MFLQALLLHLSRYCKKNHPLSSKGQPILESDKHIIILARWEHVIQSWLLYPRERRLKLLEKFPLMLDPVQTASRRPVIIYSDIRQTVDKFMEDKLHVLSEAPELYQSLTVLSEAALWQDEMAGSSF